MMEYCIVFYLMTFMVIFPVIVGLLKYKYLDKGLRVYLYLLMFMLCTEIILRILIILGFTNHWVLCIYIPMEFILISFFYSNLLSNLIHKKYFLLIIGVFVAFSVTNSLFIQDIHQINNIVIGISYIIYILYTILFYYKVIIELKIIKLHEDPAIWINSAVLFTFSAKFFFLVLGNRILQLSHETAAFLFAFPIYISGVSYIISAIGFLKVKKKVEV